MPILVLVILVVVLMVLSPALGIWAVNELLEQAGVAHQIPWNFWSWLAMWVLLGTLHGGRVVSKKG